MRLTVIGCSGSYPGPDSPASCYLVEADHAGRTWRIVLDLGNGALGALHDFVDPLSLDAVFFSHLHADHCLDLCGYWVMRKYHPSGPQPRIPVYGPAGTARRMAGAYDLPPEPGMGEVFDFHEYDESTPVELGPLRVTAVRVVHPVPAFALRVAHSEGSFVYSGDTGPCEALVRAAEGTDLLLAEASFREGEDNPPDLHLTGRDAAETATKAGVGRLVLTHIPPWHDKDAALAEALPSYAGPTELARVGRSWTL